MFKCLGIIAQKSNKEENIQKIYLTGKKWLREWPQVTSNKNKIKNALPAYRIDESIVQFISLTFQANRGSEELIQREEYLENFLRLTWKKTTRAWNIPSRQHMMCSSIHNKSKQITEAELLRMTCKDWHNVFPFLYWLTCFLSSWLVRQHHRSSFSLSVIAFSDVKFFTHQNIHLEQQKEKHSLLHPAHCMLFALQYT